MPLDLHLLAALPSIVIALALGAVVVAVVRADARQHPEHRR